MSQHQSSFRNVLFLSFSHPHTVAALRTVIAAVPDGHLRLLGVVPPAPALQRLLSPSETTQHVEDALHMSLTSELETCAAKAARERSPEGVTVEVTTGHVVGAVLERIGRHDHDLLAVTGHPDDAEARAVIARLQRKSPVPVWVLRPDRSRKRRILAAIDADGDHHGLDHRILSAAGWLARPGDELHVLSAWELLGETTLRASPFLATPEEEIERLRHDCVERVRSVLDELLAEHEFEGVDMHIHVRNATPAEAIIAEVNRSSINQLVVGTIARQGIPGFVIGNTAEQLLNRVGCSEFVVKPPVPE